MVASQFWWLILARKPTLSVIKTPTKNHNYASRTSNSILSAQSRHPLVATNDDKAPKVLTKHLERKNLRG